MTEYATPRALQLPRTSKSLWFAAAVSALALHAAAAGFAMLRMQDADAAELGAAGLEIGLELASTQAPPMELPPGPDAEASAASQAAPEQQSEVKPADLPQEKPVEADDPDRLVTLEKTEKPVEKEPEAQATPTQAAEASVAQEATATPSLQNAPVSTRSVTIDQGTGESRQRVRVTWQKELIAHLDKHKRYPSDRNAKAARITLALQLDRMGRVVSVDIAGSSGDSSFDAAAVAMVQRANPVPPPPPLVADEGLTFSLPVVFRAADRR